MNLEAGDPKGQPRPTATLQPSDEDGSDAELTEELQRFEDLPAAQRLERLADQEIVQTLEWRSFDRTCSEWKELASALVEYGYSVFIGWLVTGVVHRMAANHGGGRGVYGLNKIPENLQLMGDGAHELAAELMIAAVEAFRTKTLMAHKWRPTGGASLKTFFVGRCLMTLPDVYYRLERGTRRSMSQLRNAEHRLDDGRHSVNPLDSAVASATLDEVCAGDDRLAAMFRLQDAGYSLTEIADMFDTSEGAIRTKMSRARTAARRAQRAQK
ncbi:MAG TPA: hypothetical protein VK988_14075 [Acidimicrobiales bacterium]|nr:hypothetical protein [Acidimicrobiales bacterium]